MAFKDDHNWQIKTNGRTSVQINQDLRDKLIECITEINKRDLPGESSDGALYLRIEDEINA